MAKKKRKWASRRSSDSNEGVDLAFVSDRQYAYVADLILWHLTGLALFFGSGLRDAFLHEGHTLLVSIIAVGWRVLFLAKDGINGFSPGKYLLGLRVVNANTDEPIGVTRSVQRNLVLIIPLVGELIVMAQMSFGPRWFDGFACCKVIRFEP